MKELKVAPLLDDPDPDRAVARPGEGPRNGPTIDPDDDDGGSDGINPGDVRTGFRPGLKFSETVESVGEGKVRICGEVK